MKVKIAEKAGFCFGVQRAVDIAETSTEKYNEVYSYGQLIHNDQVTQRLESNGLKEISKIAEIPSGHVIIRSHGVGHDIYEQSTQQNLDVIDCTCPYVKKVHRIVDKHHKSGDIILIVGNPLHPEVIGINGWCENTAIIVQNVEDINELEPVTYCVVAQTTLKLDTWNNIISTLEFKHDIHVYNTICAATSERQEAAQKLAEEVDCMIVIGGYHSSNTKKLVEICQSICKNTIPIEKISDLEVTNLINYGIIGITAGASTPDWIIQDVYDLLITL